jgi:hypothetical protein
MRFRIAVRVGCLRRLATGVPDEWPSRRRELPAQNPAYRPTGTFHPRAESWGRWPQSAGAFSTWPADPARPAGLGGMRKWRANCLGTSEAIQQQGQKSGQAPASAAIARESFPRKRRRARAHPLLMESKAGSNFWLYRASFPENRFTLFRTHSNLRLDGAMNEGLPPHPVLLPLGEGTPEWCSER